VSPRAITLLHDVRADADTSVKLVGIDVRRCRRFTVMRKQLGSALVIAAFVSTNALASEIDQLAWMSGCWTASNAEPGSIEYWSSPQGGVMLGASKTVKGGKTVAHEFIQIRTLDSGKLAFIAKPSGQSEATFTLVSVSTNEIVFENPQHDFPQRISYRLVKAGELLARIEGTRNGKQRAIDYPMSKVPCSD
jgi:Domain of unknown function (DUF6265)